MGTVSSTNFAQIKGRDAHSKDLLNQAASQVKDRSHMGEQGRNQLVIGCHHLGRLQVARHEFHQPDGLDHKRFCVLCTQARLWW